MFALSTKEMKLSSSPSQRVSQPPLPSKPPDPHLDFPSPANPPVPPIPPDPPPDDLFILFSASTVFQEETTSDVAMSLPNGICSLSTSPISLTHSISRVCHLPLPCVYPILEHLQCWGKLLIPVKLFWRSFSPILMVLESSVSIYVPAFATNLALARLLNAIHRFWNFITRAQGHKNKLHMWSQSRPLQKVMQAYVEADWFASTLECGLTWWLANSHWYIISKATSRSCGIGWYLVDPGQTTLAHGSTSPCFISSALMAEAIALKSALVAAKLAHIQHINMFSDSQVLVNILSPNGMSIELKSIWFDIRCLLPTFDSILFLRIPRTAIKAVSMAKDALHLLVSSSM